MTFTFAAWNVQRLATSSDAHKVGIVEKWVHMYDPDLLLLTEVAAGQKVSGYTCVEYVNTLDKNFSKTQLCLAAYKRDASGLVILGARTLRSADGQRRATLKLNVQDGKKLTTLYLYHADASFYGGMNLLKEAISLVRVGRRTIATGDFNYDLRIDSKLLDVQNSNEVDVSQAIDEVKKRPVKKTHKGGCILDFALSSKDVQVESVELKLYTTWQTIDHCPIMFAVD
jgi:endonuclease/exonuclease/phosphatase family metal-dependent hydrolase